MRWTLPRPRFGLRTLMLAVLASAVGVWLLTNSGERLRTYRNQQARKQIDAYELAIAGEGDPRSVPPELIAILGDSRLKHWGPVHNVKLFSGKRLMSWGRDEIVRVWDIETGRQVEQWPAKALAVSGDRLLAFLVQPDGTIVKWDGTAHTPIATVDRGGEVRSVPMTANLDGSALVVEVIDAGSAREISVFDVASGELRQRIRPDKPGGGGLCITKDGSLFTWNEEQVLQVTDTATGETARKLGPIRDLRGDGIYIIGAVMLSSDEKTLYVGGALNAVVAFDWETGEERKRVGNAGGSVHQFALGVSDRSIVFGSQRWLGVFSVDSDRHWDVVRSPQGRVGVVDWHADMIAASHDKEISLSIGHELQPWRLQGGPTSAINCLAFVPAGNWIVGGTSLGEIVAWELGTWREVRRWHAHDSSIAAVFASADGSTLATASDDGTVITWDASSLREKAVIRKIRDPLAIGLSPDGGLLATNGQRFDEVQLWDATAGTPGRTIGPIKGMIWGPPAWSPDASQFVCYDNSHSLQAFDTANWKPVGAAGTTRYGQQRVHAVWTADGQRLLTTNWFDDSVQVFETGTWKSVQTLRAGTGRARWISLHPSQEWLALCGYQMPVQIWHLPTGKLVKSWQISPLQDSEVLQVHFSPDGHYLATVNGNGTAYLLTLDGVLKP